MKRKHTNVKEQEIFQPFRYTTVSTIERDEIPDILQLAEKKGINDVRLDKIAGIYYLKKMMYDSAIIKFNKTLKIDTTDNNIFINLGAAYLKKRDYDKSIFYLEKALKIDTNDYTIYGNLGSDYFMKGDSDKAMNAYSKYLEVAPKDEDYSKILSIYQRLKNKK